MTTIKLTINERTGKGKHLLALLKELAKSEVVGIFAIKRTLIDKNYARDL